MTMTARLLTMTARSLTTALAVAALASAPCTFAQAAKPSPAAAAKPAAKASAAPAAAGMPVPKPAPEMAQLKPFDGSWSCEGMMPAGPQGPAQKTKTTVKSHVGMNGFWQVGTVTMAAPPMEGMFHITYDAGQKQYVMVWVDNMGGYSQETSTGWDGDKMVFTGEGSMMGQKQQARDTFTKTNDGSSFKHASEVQMNGQWTSMGDETCHKAAAAPAKK